MIYPEYVCEASFHSQLHNSPFIAGLQGLQGKQSRHVACLQLAAKMTFYNVNPGLVDSMVY